MRTNTTIEEIQQLIKELVISQKETDRILQQTDKQLQESERQFQSMKQLLNKNAHATERKINQVMGKFDTQWGRLVESLVSRSIVRLFKEKGIEVHDTAERRRGIHGDKQFEFDIIAKNGNEIVIISVKSTLTVKYVNEHLEDLKHASTWLREYANHKIFGAVAFLRANEKSDLYAEDMGLFVIKATGDSASIINEERFKPKDWN